MDRLVRPTHSEQEGTAWSGHFGCACYHPLLPFNRVGLLGRCALGPGNVHSADSRKVVLEPGMWRYADLSVVR